MQNPINIVPYFQICVPIKPQSKSDYSQVLLRSGTSNKTNLISLWTITVHHHRVWT